MGRIRGTILSFQCYYQVADNKMARKDESRSNSQKIKKKTENEYLNLNTKAIEVLSSFITTSGAEAFFAKTSESLN